MANDKVEPSFDQSLFPRILRHSCKWVIYEKFNDLIITNDRNNQFHLDSYMLGSIVFTTILFVFLLKWCISIGLKHYSQWHAEKIESQLVSTVVASSINSTPAVDTTTPWSLDDTPDGVLCMPPTPHHHPIRRHSHTIAPAHINAIAKLSRGLAHTEYSKRRVIDTKN